MFSGSMESFLKEDNEKDFLVLAVKFWHQTEEPWQ